MKKFFYINPYYWIVKFRNFLYAKDFISSYKAGVSVISIGNISMGGTGKTSIVRWFIENFAHRLNLGILLRGYKRKTKGLICVMEKYKIKASLEEAGDEAFLLAFYAQKKGYPVYIVVDKNRVRGTQFLEKECKVDLIILDDGFQHLKLKRDLDIVLLKKKDLNASLFPFGRLREPLSALKRSSAILLTYQEVAPFEFAFENKPVFKVWRKHWKVWRQDLSSFLSQKELKNLSFIAFSGLGDNSQFLEIVKKLKLNIEEYFSFSDHYHYKNFKLNPQKNYLTTLKDSVKLPFSPNVYVLDFSVEIENFKKFIENFLKYEKLKR